MVAGSITPHFAFSLVLELRYCLKSLFMLRIEGSAVKEEVRPAQAPLEAYAPGSILASILEQLWTKQ